MREPPSMTSECKLAIAKWQGIGAEANLELAHVERAISPNTQMKLRYAMAAWIAALAAGVALL